MIDPREKSLFVDFRDRNDLVFNADAALLDRIDFTERDHIGFMNTT